MTMVESSMRLPIPHRHLIESAFPESCTGTGTDDQSDATALMPAVTSSVEYVPNRIKHPMSLEIYVDSYSGYKASELPRQFTLNSQSALNRDWEVHSSRLLARWAGSRSPRGSLHRPRRSTDRVQSVSGYWTAVVKPMRPRARRWMDR